jgi:phage shock protein PspC (stress-responsive transcriptional regulator)
MKKIININFQGRVIPIEETAYDILKQYVDSLRIYFANEEGRDEIINDIEGRIGELFGEKLKKGAACITDDDVNVVINSIGRPEQLKAEEEELGRAGAAASSKQTGSNQQQYQQQQTNERNRLTRSENDKIIGGVCAGLANYLRIDPSIVRLLFALITFGGFGTGLLIYIVMWIVLPAKNTTVSIRKRLFRNTDEKVVGGVASGLAAYFNIDTWITRLIFILPLILGGIGNVFDDGWFRFNPFSGFIFNGIGGTLFIVYIVLWIVLPEAFTAAEKLEMRGEKIDLESIKKTVKEEMQSVKGRAEKFGAEVKEFSSNFSQSTQQFAGQAAPVARRTGSGIAHAIGVLFKAFFLFIAGVIAIALFGMLIGFLFGGFAIFPVKGFLLENGTQNLLAWLTLLFFFAIPLIALITWLVRRVIGVKSRSHYLGYVFGTLWLIGLISAITLFGMIFRNFKTRSGVEEQISFIQPASGKLNIDVESSNVRYYGGDYFGVDWDDEDMPFYGINQDTMMLNTVAVHLVKSKDSLYHVYKIKFSRGNNPEEAKKLAEKVKFDVTVTDGKILLPKGFAVSRQQKFRNQQVLMVIEIPEGKKVELSRAVSDYKWFSVNANRRNGWNIQWDDNWDNNYYWNSNTEYIMAPDGLKRTDELNEQELKKGKFKLKADENGVDVEGEIELKDKEKNDTNTYRYKKQNDTTTTKVVTGAGKTENNDDEETTGLVVKTKAVVNNINNNLVSPLLSLHDLF